MSVLLHAASGCSQCVVSGLCRVWGEEGAGLEQWELGCISQLGQVPAQQLPGISPTTPSYQPAEAGDGFPARTPWAHCACPLLCQALLPAQVFPWALQSQNQQQVPVPELSAVCGGCNQSWDTLWLGAHPDPITPCLGFLQTLQKVAKNNTKIGLVRV